MYFFSSYIFPIYNPLRLYVFWFIYIVIRAISNYFAHKKDIIKDLYFRRFIYFDATLDEINAIENSVTAYNYQIKLSTSENIPQNQNEFWWVSPHLEFIKLRKLIGQEFQIYSLANSNLIFDIRLILRDCKGQKILFNKNSIYYPVDNLKYKKCKYKNLSKIDFQFIENHIIILEIWTKVHKIQLQLDTHQLQIIEELLFNNLFLFSQRNYQKIKNSYLKTTIWHNS